MARKPAAPAPRGTVPFVALRDFESEALRSAYVKGLSYTARPEDEILHGLLAEWEAEGKIRIGGGAGAMVRGGGG